jgi:hypothetical protein
MRSTWLKATVTTVLFLGLSASSPQNAADAALTDFLSALTYCGQNLGAVQRAALGKLLASATAYAQTLPAQLQTPPPLMSGLGDAHMQITTANPQAQAHFDQGLRMLHGFNHGEAARAFRYAQELDPNCAMCFWGEAFALGPNINAPMDANNNDAAYRTARAALDKSQSAAAPERALIEAMPVRYTRQWPADRAPMDSAWHGVPFYASTYNEQDRPNMASPYRESPFSGKLLNASSSREIPAPWYPLPQAPAEPLR